MYFLRASATLLAVSSMGSSTGGRCYIKRLILEAFSFPSFVFIHFVFSLFFFHFRFLFSGEKEKHTLACMAGALEVTSEP